MRAFSFCKRLQVVGQLLASAHTAPPARRRASPPQEPTVSKPTSARVRRVRRRPHRRGTGPHRGPRSPPRPPRRPIARSRSSAACRSELGCPDDWQPGVRRHRRSPPPAPRACTPRSSEFPPGTYEYKVAVNDSWDEDYGADGVNGGANIPLTVAGPRRCGSVFDDPTHRIGVEVQTRSRRVHSDDDALVAPPVRQPGSDEQFYFVMTDRFANGDTSNDTAGLTGDRLATGFDPTDSGFYNGGDIAGLREKLDYIDGPRHDGDLADAELQEPARARARATDASAGYHGYWITDFTQIDPHLGTNQELEELIDDAHDQGHQGLLRHHHEPHGRRHLLRRGRRRLHRPGRRARIATRRATTSTPRRTPAPTTSRALDAGDRPSRTRPSSHRRSRMSRCPRGSTTRRCTTTAATRPGRGSPSRRRLRRARRPDDRASDRRRRLRRRVPGLDRPRHRRVPHRHRQARQLRVLGEVDDRGARLRARGRQARLLHVRRGLRRRPGEALAVRPQDRHELGARLHLPERRRTRTPRAARPSCCRRSSRATTMYTTPDSSATALPTFLGNHDMGRIGYFLARPTTRSQRDSSRTT